MMIKPNSKIENIKTFILVVLSLSTILLLYFFWWDISFDDIKFPEEAPRVEVPDVKEVTQPEQMIARFGGNSVVIPQNEQKMWFSGSANESDKNQYNFIDEFSKFTQSEDIVVEEITKKQYTEIMSYPSVEVDFAYAIPFGEFCSQYGVKKTQTFETIELMTCIGYSQGRPESLFIFDGSNNKYYRLVSDADHTDFASLITDIEERNYPTYYTLGTAMGIDNHILIPLEFYTAYEEFNAKQEIFSEQTEKIAQIAESFFGESFDFIRKIVEDNGTIIYMYGYGEKTLIFTPEGTLEFKEEQKDENYVSQKYFEALETVLQFVGNHGTWDSFSGADMQIYVKDAHILSGKKKSYRFTFGIRIADGELYYESGEAIVVEVTGGQVTYYKRDMIDYERKELPNNTNYEYAFSAINTVAQNYEYMNSVLTKEGIIFTRKEGENNTLEDIAEHITAMKSGYLRMRDNNSNEYRLKPVWVISIENMNIYFDLYDAAPISYSVTKAKEG